MEPWVDWLVRATSIADVQRVKAKIEEWDLAQRRRYWRWAGHVARRTDRRWSSEVLLWTPSDGHRRRGRPRKRWVDDINLFFKETYQVPEGDWYYYAADRDTWSKMEDQFVNFSYWV